MFKALLMMSKKIFSFQNFIACSLLIKVTPSLGVILIWLDIRKTKAIELLITNGVTNSMLGSKFGVY
jgi:hypothetical protein